MGPDGGTGQKEGPQVRDAGHFSAACLIVEHERRPRARLQDDAKCLFGHRPPASLDRLGKLGNRVKPEYAADKSLNSKREQSVSAEGIAYSHVG
jgi:hypothetical protein